MTCQHMMPVVSRQKTWSCQRKTNILKLPAMKRDTSNLTQILLKQKCIKVWLIFDPFTSYLEPL